ncbi:auxin-responsive protein SAUR22-like [Abeliophyllum distichum]|uniref:Auxin-responsive protein SAUR22-like n=1 Tax=Abeliophyllum distichum TaxID=126358 RepID=A0ABD1QVI0_9LAMI
MTILFEKIGELVKKLSFKSEKNKYELLIDDINGGKKCKKERVRCGFFPIYVGEERKKYLVPGSNSPTLKTLLDHYEEQFNRFEPIALPSISPKKFDQLLAIIKAETQLLTIVKDEENQSSSCNSKSKKLIPITGHGIFV